MDRLSLKSPGLETEVRTLSGGNQQKVVIGRWLLRESRVYLLDSPTAAVDVHTKAEIYGLAREPRRRGAAVSSPPPSWRNSCGSATASSCSTTGESSASSSGEDNNVNSIMRLSFGRNSV